LVGVEAAGDGIATGRHAATLGAGRVGVLHGSKSYVLVATTARSHTRTRSARGSTTRASGPSTRLEGGRPRSLPVANRRRGARRRRAPGPHRGILCALETAHAIAALDEVARHDRPDSAIIVGLSGRGDKDMVTIAQRRAR